MKNGFYPKGDNEALYEADSIMAACNDLFASYAKFMFGGMQGEAKEEARLAFVATLEKFLTILDKKLSQNKKSKLHVAGGKLSQADFKVLATLWSFCVYEDSAVQPMGAPVLEKFSTAKNYIMTHFEKTFKEFTSEKRTPGPM